MSNAKDVVAYLGRALALTNDLASAVLTVDELRRVIGAHVSATQAKLAQMVAETRDPTEAEWNEMHTRIEGELASLAAAAGVPPQRPSAPAEHDTGG